jgi:hypothetical protein
MLDILVPGHETSPKNIDENRADEPDGASPSAARLHR